MPPHLERWKPEVLVGAETHHPQNGNGKKAVARMGLAWQERQAQKGLSNKYIANEGSMSRRAMERKQVLGTNTSEASTK